EKPRGRGDSHRAAYEFYWPQASKNPMIDKGTIAISERPSYSRVEYELLGEFGGKKFKQKSVNYYIAFGGKWVDVHISVIMPTPEDEVAFTTFDNTLTYGLSKAPEAKDTGAHSYPIPGHGALELVIPPPWRDAVRQPPRGFPPTIEVTPAAGDRFKLLVTVLWNMKPGENINEPGRLKQMVSSAGERALPTAIEKELNLLELKQGE